MTTTGNWLKEVVFLTVKESKAEAGWFKCLFPLWFSTSLILEKILTEFLRLRAAVNVSQYLHSHLKSTGLAEGWNQDVCDHQEAFVLNLAAGDPRLFPAVQKLATELFQVLFAQALQGVCYGLFYGFGGHFSLTNPRLANIRLWTASFFFRVVIEPATFWKARPVLPLIGWLALKAQSPIR